MKKYHPALVALHWLLAALIVIALVAGSQILAKTPNADPTKMFGFKAHMGNGIIILVLMITRFAIRFFTAKPPHTDIGNDLLNKGAIWAHYAIYVVVIAMSLSGLALANAAGLPDIVFGGSGDPLPADFSEYTARAVHGIVSKLLMLLLLTHVLAALYHQFVRKDSLFSRMWFGTRS